MLLYFFPVFSVVGKCARLEALDTLTAPTLEPDQSSEVEDEPKLTIITPSSVVVMSTPASRPATTTSTPSTQLPWVCCQNKPRVKRDSTKGFHFCFRVQKESVSHSFSVVSVKYSSSKAAAAAAAAAAEAGLTASTSSEEVTSSTNSSLKPEEELHSEGAGLKQTWQSVDSSTVVTTLNEEFTQQESSHSESTEAIEAVFVSTDQRAPKAIVSNEQQQSNDRFLNSFPHLSVTTSTTTTTTTASSTFKPVITTMEATEAKAEEEAITTTSVEGLTTHRKVSV